MMKLSRRTLLGASAMAGLGMMRHGAHAGLSATAFVPKSQRSADHVLVVIFLRGGADGLSVVPPIAEDEYYRLRPTLAFGRPSGEASIAGRAIDLDGHFGLHPSLMPFKTMYDEGELAIIHACGSGDTTHSHFEAMATMERGLKSDSSSGASDGWLARYLNASDGDTNSTKSAALRAVAIGEMLPQSLVGATGATALERVQDLALNLPFHDYNGLVMSALNSMYPAASTVPIIQSGHETLRLLQAIDSLQTQSSMPRNGAHYQKDDLSQGLSQVAILMRANLGLEVACIDHMGYDTHVAQGGSIGPLAAQLKSLSSAVDSFRTDLGPEMWANTTVVLQSEFGRRVEENSGLGTDHGSGGVMMVMGGDGVRGGKVYGRWPTLKSQSLDGPGDLAITTDYRSVLSEVLVNRCKMTASISDVFNGLTVSPLGIV
jgi:uncharacterized protein (DUF1501 family)